MNLPALTYRQKIWLGLPLLILLVWLSVLGISALIRHRMQNFLSHHGIGEAAITNFSRDRGGELMFSNVKLDHDGFSTIGDLRAQLRWSFLFAGPSFSEVIIDRLALTGDVDEDGHISIAGLKAPTIGPLIETNSVILNSGKLDLATPAGALQFNFKGRMTRQADDSQKIEAALWGSQYQLVLDTRWNATVLPDAKWTAGVEIKEVRLNLPHMNLSRGNGWFSLAGILNSTPAIEGQLYAGALRLGQNTVFNDVNLTVSGPAGQSHVILHGAVGAYQNMQMTADVIEMAKDIDIHAVVEAGTIDDLLNFLTHFKNDLQLALPHHSGLTTLLITPGNLNRIRAAAARYQYNHLKLVLDGAPDNLVGKIIINAPGNPIIYMNPAEKSAP